MGPDLGHCEVSVLGFFFRFRSQKDSHDFEGQISNVCTVLVFFFWFRSQKDSHDFEGQHFTGFFSCLDVLENCKQGGWG